MAKIIFALLAFCITVLFTTSSAHEIKGKSFHYEHHPTTYGHVVHNDDFEDHYELYSAFANGIFDFVAKLIRAKVEILLWLKKAAINFLIYGFGQLRHVMVHHAEFVNGIVHTIAEFTKILLTSKPHFAIPNLGKLLTETEHEYMPNHGHGRY